MNFIDGNNLRLINLDNIVLINWELDNRIEFITTNGDEIVWLYNTGEEVVKAMNEILLHLKSKDALFTLTEVK